MQIETKALGRVEVLPEQILEFPEGLLGFREYRRFALLDDKGDSPFKWIQSVEDPNLAFILIQPELFMRSEYKPIVMEAELEAVGVKRVADCLVFLIVTIPESCPEQMTANLQGPLLINKKTKVGRQVVSLDENHPVRLPILDQLDG